ncbi:MAG: TonB-dependent receptor, partial [Candidatus Didemnitutus sp.]|nr:TonB-dependent receptor [Candidatus Didemnitutus sp.]
MPFPIRIFSLLLFLAAFTVAGAQIIPEEAETTPDQALDLAPLRVTADLWSTPLDRIPASVTVYDAPTLQSAAVRHFGDLADQIPNFTWTGGSSRPRYFQIRGVGENSQFEGETPDSAVRFLVDDFDFTGLGTLGSTFDVSQVEVLRGPQAGAFGANAAGGVVQLVTNAPTPFWTGRVETSVGEDALRSGGIALGGPLLAGDPEKLMMRFAVQQHASDGFRHNLTLNRATNARDEFTARLRLTWNASSAWRWEAGLLFSDVNNGYDEFALDNNGWATFSDQPGRDEQRSTAASLRGTYRGWSHTQLTSVTSATWVDSRYSYDDDWTAASYRGFSDLHRDRSVFNQELRLDSEPGRRALNWINRWTLGAYFTRTEEQSTYRNEDPGNLRGLDSDYEATGTAVFGQVAHDFTQRTRAIFSLRAERVAVAGEGTKSRLRKSRGTHDPVVTLRPRFDDTLFGGKITFEHSLSERALAFASLTRGYKAGGVNLDARINPASDPLTYGTEQLWNYEIGLRGNGLDQRLRGEITVFHLVRQDTQVRDSAGFGGNYRFFTDNGNGARVTGLEASASFEVTSDWTLRGSVGLMDSELDRFTIANGNPGGGRRLANTPRSGYTLGTRYRAPSGFFASAELVGRARQFDSNNHDEARRAFRIVNATLGYEWHDWTIALWSRNLFNERYEKRVFYFGNADPDYLETRYEDRADPRQIGVSVAL